MRYAHRIDAGATNRHVDGMTLYPQAIEQTQKMLRNLRAWLEQAKTFAGQLEFEPDVLLSYRLAPNQFPLLRQIQICCDTAKLTAARLTGKDAPSHADDQTTIDELLTRIDDVTTYLSGFAAADFDGAAERLIALPFAPGKGARGAEYYRSFAQPNFYFHITTAYALMRHAGVPLGKRGFIGHLEIEDLPS